MRLRLPLAFRTLASPADRNDTNHVAAYALQICFLIFASAASARCAEPSQTPKGLESERDLPSRYGYVADDVMRLSKPDKGFWIDLGAGKGDVAIALIRAAGNPVVMVDPDMEAMTKGLEAARQQGMQDRLLAVAGSAESLPFPDGVADLVVSRGSIFFWKDPVQGLREVHRVLRPGGKAFIGGGAGSGYPKESVAKLIQQRKDQLSGSEAEKWKKFVELRRPDQMKEWATSAGLTNFEVLGRGAIDDHPKVGQGVWLLYTKPSATTN
jgi:SAM-dependent methyltransferase